MCGSAQHEQQDRGNFYRLEKVVEQSHGNIFAEQKTIYKRLFPAAVELISLLFLSTNGVFRLLRGSPSRILRNPQQRDF